MIVIYDYQIMFGQKYGGISRYFHELILRFKQNNEIIPKVFCIFNDNAYFSGKRQIRIMSKIKGRRMLNNIITKSYMLLAKYDIYHPTYYDPYFIKFNKGKLVITVYDMIHEKLPQSFLPNDLTAQNKKRFIEKADGIIAISYSTKNDIIALFPNVKQEKIKVIYLSTDMSKSSINERPAFFPKKYILFVGRRDGYKNFVNFCKAVQNLLIEDKELNILCVGGGCFTEDELSLMGIHHNRYYQMNLNDELLSAAYTFAECFVFPSLYEGFGIPTLEAFACECPVALSNTSSMPEVGGDAVLYFNPEDINNMYETIKKILDSEDLRRELIKKGNIQKEKFKWDEISEQTICFYKSVLNENNKA